MIVSRVLTPATFEFACHSKACAPPPVGRGGSLPGRTRPGRLTTTGVTGPNAPKRAKREPITYNKFNGKKLVDDERHYSTGDGRNTRKPPHTGRGNSSYGPDAPRSIFQSNPKKRNYSKKIKRQNLAMQLGAGAATIIAAYLRSIGRG